MAGHYQNPYPHSSSSSQPHDSIYSGTLASASSPMSPPPAQSAPAPPYANYSHPTPGLAAVQVAHPSQPARNSGSPNGAFSDPLASDFPSVGALAKEDLQDLLTDPNYFTAIFEDLPQVRQMRQAQAELIGANEALIQKNFDMRPQLESLRAETAKAFDDAQQQLARWRELELLQNELYQQYTPSRAYSRLLTAHHDADRHSEQLAAEFVDAGAMDEEEFVRQFREVRTTYHKRGLVVGRWSDGGVSWDA